MEPNAVVYLTLGSSRVFEANPLLEGSQPLSYEVFVQRIEPEYIVLRVPRPESEVGYNLLYLSWQQIIAIEMAEGLSHHVVRKPIG